MLKRNNNKYYQYKKEDEFYLVKRLLAFRRNVALTYRKEDVFRPAWYLTSFHLSCQSARDFVDKNPATEEEIKDYINRCNRSIRKIKKLKPLPEYTKKNIKELLNIVEKYQVEIRKLFIDNYEYKTDKEKKSSKEFVKLYADLLVLSQEFDRDEEVVYEQKN